MAIFIDDILVATDIEEGYDELVEEVLKRLEENDLFVVMLKGAKGTISLAQAKNAVPGPNYMLKSLWEGIKNEGIKKRI